MFPYFQNYKKINDQSHFFTDACSADLVIKFTFNVPLSYIINSFRRGHIVSMQFARYCKTLIWDDVKKPVSGT